MTPRPKNPPADRRAAILEAALRVFAQRGYTAATNADIAREAGVTAAALYYYFPSKADLFKAAVAERRSFITPTLDHFGDQLHEIPLEVFLPVVVRTVVGLMKDPTTQALIRIIMAEGPRNPELVSIWQTQLVGSVAPSLFRYAHHQMEQGRLRPMDPRLLAMMLNGPILMTLLARDLLGVELLQGLSDDELVDQLTQTLLGGLGPGPNDRQKE